MIDMGDYRIRFENQLWELYDRLDDETSHYNTIEEIIRAIQDDLERME